MRSRPFVHKPAKKNKVKAEPDLEKRAKIATRHTKLVQYWVEHVEPEELLIVTSGNDDNSTPLTSAFVVR